MFRTGDVVEAQVTFMVIPLKEQKRKMLAVLRSLALIKGDIGKVTMTHHVYKPTSDTK
jgi:hypothetical protein